METTNPPPPTTHSPKANQELPNRDEEILGEIGDREPGWRQAKPRKGKAKREARNKGNNQGKEVGTLEAIPETEDGGQDPGQGKRPLEDNSPATTPKGAQAVEGAGPSSPHRFTFGEYYSRALVVHGERQEGGASSPILKQTSKKQRQTSPGKLDVERHGPIGTPRRLALGWDPPCNFPPRIGVGG